MIIYNVTVAVDNAIQKAWLQWMQDIHIPDVLRTGLFTDCLLMRIADAENAQSASFAVQYKLKNADNLDLYFKKFAPKLQAEHTKKFGNSCHAFRTVMEVEKTFSGQG